MDRRQQTVLDQLGLFEDTKGGMSSLRTFHVIEDRLGQRIDDLIWNLTGCDQGRADTKRPRVAHVSFIHSAWNRRDRIIWIIGDEFFDLPTRHLDQHDFTFRCCFLDRATGMSDRENHRVDLALANRAGLARGFQFGREPDITGFPSIRFHRDIHCSA